MRGKFSRVPPILSNSDKLKLLLPCTKNCSGRKEWHSAPVRLQSNNHDSACCLTSKLFASLSKSDRLSLTIQTSNRILPKSNKVSKNNLFIRGRREFINRCRHASLRISTASRAQRSKAFAHHLLASQSGTFLCPSKKQSTRIFRHNHHFSACFSLCSSFC